MSIRKAKLMAIMAAGLIATSSEAPPPITYNYKSAPTAKLPLSNKQKKARVKSKAARKARRK